MRTLIFALAMLTGCSISAKKKQLGAVELDHYRALEVYMDQPDASGKRPKTERKELLSLKTEEERNQWLKDKKLWDHFYQYPPHIREKISQGDVQVGWTIDMVQMAWGRQMKKEKPPACPVSRCWRYIYRFEQLEDGTTQVWVEGSKDEYRAVRIYDREVEVGDDRVMEINTKSRR